MPDPDATPATPKQALERAIKIAGGQTALGALIGAKQQTISFWLNESGRVGAEYALLIERALSGQVTRQQLRPDLYPPEEAAA